jgi:hypothetical protein
MVGVFVATPTHIGPVDDPIRHSACFIYLVISVSDNPVLSIIHSPLRFVGSSEIGTILYPFSIRKLATI